MRIPAPPRLIAPPIHIPPLLQRPPPLRPMWNQRQGPVVIPELNACSTSMPKIHSLLSKDAHEQVSYFHFLKYCRNFFNSKITTNFVNYFYRRWSSAVCASSASIVEGTSNVPKPQTIRPNCAPKRAYFKLAYCHSTASVAHSLEQSIRYSKCCRSCSTLSTYGCTCYTEEE